MPLTDIRIPCFWFTLCCAAAFKKSFHGSNADVVESLPAFARNAFPLHLTKRGAIDKETLDMLHVEICTVSNFSAVADKFSELAHKRGLQAAAEYSDYVVSRGLPPEPQPVALARGQKSMTDHVQTVRSTSTDPLKNVHIDPNKIAELFDYHPSAGWLSCVFLDTTKDPVQWMRHFMMTVSGKTLAMDHTFKICDAIRGSDRKPLYTGCFTVMNELCQVAAQFMVQTKTWVEVQAGLTMLYQRFQLLCEENPGTATLQVRAVLV